MNAPELITAVREADPEPCRHAFSLLGGECPNLQTCCNQRMACEAFRDYLDTGRYPSPYFHGTNPVIQRLHAKWWYLPSRAIYRDIFERADA